MYKVEKNIPTPIGSSSYPFSEMELGDSFLVPFDETDPIEINKIRSRIWTGVRTFRANANRGFNVKIRKVENGLRVWRV